MACTNLIAFSLLLAFVSCQTQVPDSLLKFQQELEITQESLKTTIEERTSALAAYLKASGEEFAQFVTTDMGKMAAEEMGKPDKKLDVAIDVYNPVTHDLIAYVHGTIEEPRDEDGSFANPPSSLSDLTNRFNKELEVGVNAYNPVTGDLLGYAHTKLDKPREVTGGSVAEEHTGEHTGEHIGEYTGEYTEEHTGGHTEEIRARRDITASCDDSFLNFGPVALPVTLKKVTVKIGDFPSSHE